MPKGVRLKTYRRIKVNVFRRRVTIFSGEWPDANFDASPTQTDDHVSLNGSDSCEPVAPDSPEGQLILVEAIRFLEQGLSPDVQTAAGGGQDTRPLEPMGGLRRKFLSLYQLIHRKATLLGLRENDSNRTYR